MSDAKHYNRALLTCEQITRFLTYTSSLSQEVEVFPERTLKRAEGHVSSFNVTSYAVLTNHIKNKHYRSDYQCPSSVMLRYKQRCLPICMILEQPIHLDKLCTRKEGRNNESNNKYLVIPFT